MPPRTVLPQTPPPKQRIPANPNSTSNSYNTGLVGIVTGFVTTVIKNAGAIARRGTSAAVAGAAPGYVSNPAVPSAPTPTATPPVRARKGPPSIGSGVAAAVNANASATNVPGYVPPHYVKWVQQAAAGTGLPASVVAAQINMESGFNPGATSPTGAQGIAQFEPGTWKSQGIAGSPYNPQAALLGYTKLMKALINQYHGNVRDALAAYNAGPGNLAAGYGYADSILSTSGVPSKVTAGTPAALRAARGRPGGAPSSTGGVAPSSTGGLGGAGGAGGLGGLGGAGAPGGATGGGDSGIAAIQQSMADYQTLLNTGRVAPPGTANPLQWWWSSFSGNWQKFEGGGPGGT